VFVVNPLVPNRVMNGGSMRARGVYTIMEQAGRIYSQNLLQLGMASLAVKFPQTIFHLLQPPQDTALLFGPSMGFEASQAALRFGYSSTQAWLNTQGAELLRQLEWPDKEPPWYAAADARTARGMVRAHSTGEPNPEWDLLVAAHLAQPLRAAERPPIGHAKASAPIAHTT